MVETEKISLRLSWKGEKKSELDEGSKIAEATSASRHQKYACDI